MSPSENLSWRHWKYTLSQSIQGFQIHFQLPGDRLIGLIEKNWNRLVQEFSSWVNTKLLSLSFSLSLSSLYFLKVKLSVKVTFIGWKWSVISEVHQVTKACAWLASCQSLSSSLLLFLSLSLFPPPPLEYIFCKVLIRFAPHFNVHHVYTY